MSQFLSISADPKPLLMSQLDVPLFCALSHPVSKYSLEESFIKMNKLHCIMSCAKHFICFWPQYKIFEFIKVQMLPISLQGPVLHDCILFDTVHPASHVFKCTHLLWGENYKCSIRSLLPRGLRCHSSALWCCSSNWIPLFLSLNSFITKRALCHFKSQHPCCVHRVHAL